MLHLKNMCIYIYLYNSQYSLPLDTKINLEQFICPCLHLYQQADEKGNHLQHHLSPSFTFPKVQFQNRKEIELLDPKTNSSSV